VANISSAINKYRIFQGPAVVYLGASGSTPTEIGGIFNVSLEIGLEAERFVQGFPKQLQELYVKARTAKVKFDTAEAGDFTLLRYALGSASLNSTAYEHLISIGDQTTLSKCAIQLLVINAEGVTETIRIWEAIGGVDGITIGMNDDGLHTPSYTFEALRKTQDWAGASLVDGVCNLGSGMDYKNAQLLALHIDAGANAI